MKKIALLFTLAIALFFAGCKDNRTSENVKVISPQEVHEAVYDSGNHQLIDVRTLEEFNEGHLKQSQNICVTDDDFKENIAKLDKDQPVYLYCRSGKRSANAAEILREMGFTEIYDMEGGILNWQNQRLETEK